jgi:integrase
VPEAVLVRAGLPDVRWYDLRHTAASLLAEPGVPPCAVMETLGRSGIAVTMDVYTHVLPGQQRSVAAAMDALFADRPAPPSPSR